MKLNQPLFVVLLVAGFALAWSQDRPFGDRGIYGDTTLNPDGAIDPDIPKAALLTDKGMELAARLRTLREAEERMGSKHPSLPEVQRQIAQIRVQLKDWADKPVREGELPPKRDGAAAFTQQELQQIVLRLAEEVDVLKQKVARLEGQR